MSLVTVSNHREHDIDLHMPNGAKVTVPAGTFPDKRTAIVPGTVGVESADVDKLKKANAAVHSMFEEGWLSMKVAAATKSAADDDGNKDKK